MEGYLGFEDRKLEDQTWQGKEIEAALESME